MITATRYHDISMGHRVYGHESKCKHLHGHNYRIHFTVLSEELDSVGRVIDFSQIKSILCEWVEKNWDHKFAVWQKDPIKGVLQSLDPEGVIVTSFNPTAENLAQFLLNISVDLLDGTGVVLTRCSVEETRKCSAEATLDDSPRSFQQIDWDLLASRFVGITGGKKK